MEPIVLVNPIAESYAAVNTSPLDPLLQEIERYTKSHVAQPHMLSGHVQGKLLQCISQMLSPARILEIGTFTGFSALCLASGLKPNGHLHTIEVREADAQLAQSFVNKSSLKEQITIHCGDARTIIPQLIETWDLVFIDADKTSYIDYYELTLPRLRAGGIILADNVLFHGQVLQEPVQGKNAIAIDAFNKHVMADERTEKLMLTVRDGIMIIKKR